VSQKYYVRTMGISNLARPLALVIGVVLTSAAASPALAQSANQYQKACDDGDLPACTSLGVAYAQGSGVPLDLARAVALFQKACDGGEPGGCNDLGVSYATGSGVPIDQTRSRALYLKACEGGEARGCENLALKYLRGSESPRIQRGR